MSNEEELYDYYFPEDLLSRFSHSFNMDRAISDFISLCKGKNAKEIDGIAQKSLGRYVNELSVSLAKSERDSLDRSGVIIYQVAEKTGMKFPSVPQRLLELGFMATRPLDKLSVAESNPKTLVLRVANCAAFAELKDKLGDKESKFLPCRHGCLANTDTLFSKLGMATRHENTAKICEKGFCEFTIRSQDERS
ncbi:MAG: hypothetical protein WED04_04415 [Promethearchaeati archaeon SRVP18_Atabeyarchaeia-1]